MTNHKFASQKQLPNQISDRLQRSARCIYWFVMLVAFLFSAWILWLRLNSGLEISTPKFLLFNFLLIIATVLGLIYSKHRQTKCLQSPKFLRVVLIGAIVLGIICRLAFMLLAGEFQPIDAGTDTSVHYYAAQEILSTGHIQTEGTGVYEAYHTQLTSYTLLTTLCMKIFGVNYFAILIPNTIFDLLGALAIYLLLRRWQNEKIATIGVIFWLLNPLGIIFCAEILALTVVNALIAWVLYIIYLAYTSIIRQNYQTMLGLLVASGILSAVGNSLRLVFSIIFIALTILIIIQIIQRPQHYHVAWLLGGLVAFTVVFIGSSALIERSYLIVNPHYHSEDVGHGALGWNLFVGANYNTYGRWSLEDWELMSPRLYGGEMTPTEINSDFTRMALERYRQMSPGQFIAHFVNKSKILFCRNEITIIRNLEEQFTSVDGSERWYWFLNNSALINLTVFAVLTFTFFCFIFQKRKARPDYFAFFLALCFCGLLASSLLVEVMSRYVSIFLFPFVIFSSVAAYQLLQKFYSRHKVSCGFPTGLPTSTSA